MSELVKVLQQTEDGKPIHSLRVIEYKGRRAVIGVELGEVLGYGRGGRDLITIVGREWKDELEGGKDFEVVEGSDLRDLKALLDGNEGSSLPWLGKTSVLILVFESGINLILQLTKKPTGKALRRFFADVVMPEIMATGGYVSGMSEKQALAALQERLALAERAQDEERRARLALAERHEGVLADLQQQTKASQRAARQLRANLGQSIGKTCAAQALAWMHSIADLRRFRADHLTESMALKDVEQDLRERLGGFTLRWRRLPLLKLALMNETLSEIERAAYRDAKRRGFGGPPPDRNDRTLPFVVCDDDDDEEDEG